ncbi:UNKNOWN [Stylonychia lemnae]|uniref:Uncharacterized protein n=1 Tax=Stylonychia lemnae TaxID=5949 RepID=A0A078AIX9_STYLE|nr:UNKNOWN [Stylonychia lemnae]|eukprot:CDW82280.1 UNKNOWN [Stylonychia lemnae]
MNKLLAISLALLVVFASSKKIVITEEQRLSYYQKLRQEFLEAQQAILHIQQDINNLQNLQPALDDNGSLIHTLEISDYPKVEKRRIRRRAKPKNIVKNLDYVFYGNHDNIRFDIDKCK